MSQALGMPGTLSDDKSAKWLPKKDVVCWGLGGGLTGNLGMEPLPLLYPTVLQGLENAWHIASAQ